MGASQSSFRPPGVVPSTSYSYLGELGADIQYEKSMGSSRFLKAIKARHRHGSLVVKVFLKIDPHMVQQDLRPTSKRIAAEKTALADVLNVLTYHDALATERGGYLIRQWVASSLYDRISTRPFLSLIEKKWIVFQMLSALRDIHARKISHGDIKSENILVTSWNWVFMSDFASAFKPAYLPEDDPADFSYFFDTSGRRTCYLAPERFYTTDSEIGRRKAGLEVGKSFGKVTEAMDVFGLGCVIGELFVEGTPPFTLSQLFKYRSGEYNLDAYLSQIEDEALRGLVKSMTSLDPAERLSCDQYLADAYGTVFPTSFYDFLRDFFASVNDIGSGWSTASQGLLSRLSSQIGSATGTSTPQQQGTPQGPLQQEIPALQTLPSNADEIINRVYAEFEHLERYFTNEPPRTLSALDDAPHRKMSWTNTLYPLHPHVATLLGQDDTLASRSPPAEDGPALLILSLVCANIRNCIRPASIIRAFDLMLALSPYLTDETKLDRLLPYVVTLLNSETATVRAAALRTLTQTLSNIEMITPSNAAIFPEYILPNVFTFSSDPDEYARVAYAQSLASLASSGQRYLDMTQAMKADGSLRLTRAHDFDGVPYQMSYDASLLDLQNQFQEQVNLLLIDPSVSVRRALVANITPLCSFLGRSRTSDVFGLMTTHLNDNSWLLRSAFFEAIVGISTCMSLKSVDEFILPLMTEALADNEEAVVIRELNSLTTLAELGYYQRNKLWECIAIVITLLCHPNGWIRSASASFIAASTKHLAHTEVWCTLYPALRKMLKADIQKIDEFSILNTSVGPLNRVIYEASVTWASRAAKSPFWRPRKRTENVPLAKTFDELTRLPLLSEEDKIEMQRLHTLGMTEKDSFKLLALREYIVSVAHVRKSASAVTLANAEHDLLASGGEVQLASLGVTPQTIIFSTTDSLAARLPSKLHQTENWPRRWSSHELPRQSSAIDLTRPPGSRTVSVGSTADALRRKLVMTNATSAPSSGMTGSGSPRVNSQPLRPPFPPSPSSQVSTNESSSGSTRQNDSSSEHLADSSATIRGPASDVSLLARQKSKINMHGVEVSKVSAAVSPDMTMAVGMMTQDRGPDTETGSGVSASIYTKPAGKTDGRRFVSTYEGDDPSIKQLLDRVYLDNYREPMPEFGPHIPAKVPRRRALRPGQSRERNHRRPEGTLVAHLVEHTAAISSIAVAPDHLFFATGSHDGTVKVWDSTRLEKNVTSKSRQSIQQGGRITSVVMLENSHCVASASTNGSIWVSRVDVHQQAGALPRYGKQAVIRQHAVDSTSPDHATCMLHYDTDSASRLIYGTAQSKIVVLDIRTLRIFEEYENPKHLGPISCICIDRKHSWLIVGTLSGYLSLWDLRFGLLLQSWKIDDSPLGSAVTSCVVHRTRGRGKWVLVTHENSEGFEVWDIENARQVEAFKVGERSESGPLQRAGEDDLQVQVRQRMNSAATITPTSVGGSTMQLTADLEMTSAAAIEHWLNTISENNDKLGDASPSVQADNEEHESSSALHASQHRSRGTAARTLLVGSDYSNSQESAVLAVGSLPPLTEQLGSSIGTSGELSTRQKVGGPSTSSVPEHGWIISGGEDRKLRFWDLGNLEKSVVVNGSDEGEERPTYSVVRSSTPQGDTPTVYTERTPPSRPSGAGRRTQLITSNQHTLLKAHQDAITALAILELPFRCIISGDRSGVIKAWE